MHHYDAVHSYDACFISLWVVFVQHIYLAMSFSSHKFSNKIENIVIHIILFNYCRINYVILYYPVVIIL